MPPVGVRSTLDAIEAENSDIRRCHKAIPKDIAPDH